MTCSVLQSRLLLVLALATAVEHAVIADEHQVQGFLKNHCVKCHSENEPKAGVQLNLLRFPVTGENHKQWKEVVHNIQRGDMPPEDTEQPTDIQRKAFLANVIQKL